MRIHDEKGQEVDADQVVSHPRRPGGGTRKRGGAVAAEEGGRVMEQRKSFQDVEAAVAGPTDRWPGPQKFKRVRDYSNGSLRLAIRRCHSTKQLLELRDYIQAGVDARAISIGTARKLNKAGAAKLEELELRESLLP
jgi:hypothetical protein